MDRGHVDPVRQQGCDHGIDLIAGKNKIAGNGSFAGAGRLEVDRRRYAHRPHRCNLHSAFHDRIAVDGRGALIVADDLSNTIWRVTAAKQ